MGGLAAKGLSVSITPLFFNEPFPKLSPRIVKVGHYKKYREKNKLKFKIYQNCDVNEWVVPRRL